MTYDKDWLDEDNSDEVFDDGLGVDKEVFETFFKENYCEVSYSDVRNEFLEIAERGIDRLFIDSADYSKIIKKNFIVYLRGEVYGEFESVVFATFDTINPEICDAVMDVSTTMEHQGEITEVYWETCEKLLKDFLGQLYEEKISDMIEAVNFEK